MVATVRAAKRSETARGKCEFACNWLAFESFAQLGILRRKQGSVTIGSAISWIGSTLKFVQRYRYVLKIIAQDGVCQPVAPRGCTHGTSPNDDQMVEAATVKWYNLFFPGMGLSTNREDVACNIHDIKLRESGSSEKANHFSRGLKSELSHSA